MPYSDPQKRRASVREAVQRYRATGGSKPPRKPLPELAELRIDTARDVLGVLRGQVSAVLADKGILTLDRARCIALLCSGLLRAFEQTDLVERLEKLEAAAGEKQSWAH